MTDFEVVHGDRSESLGTGFRKRFDAACIAYGIEDGVLKKALFNFALDMYFNGQSDAITNFSINIKRGNHDRTDQAG